LRALATELRTKAQELDRDRDLSLDAPSRRSAGGRN
jgi:hypothetical protein